MRDKVSASGLVCPVVGIQPDISYRSRARLCRIWGIEVIVAGFPDVGAQAKPHTPQVLQATQFARVGR